MAVMVSAVAVAVSAVGGCCFGCWRLLYVVSCIFVAFRFGGLFVSGLFVLIVTIETNIFLASAFDSESFIDPGKSRKAQTEFNFNVRHFAE